MNLEPCTALLKIPLRTYDVGHLTLHQAVESLQKYLCAQNDWHDCHLKVGSWSYDNLAHLIYILNEWCLQKWTKQPKVLFTTEMLSKVVFRAWKDNYLYWRDYQPYLKNKRYFLPNKIPFNEERDLRAKTLYKDLPQEQKEKNVIYVDWYVSHLREHAKIMYSDDAELNAI